MNKASNELESESQNLQYVMMERPAEDEISLIDLWLVLVKRKKIFFIIILLSLVVGFLFVSSKPLVYEFSTSIEVGTQPTNGRGEVAIESTQTTLAKLQEGYIPLVLASYYINLPEWTEEIDIKASVAKGSGIIRLSISGLEHNAEIYRRLLSDVVEKIKLDHKRVSSLVVNDLQLGIKKQENISSQLMNESLLMQSQMKRLDKKELLLNKRIDSLSEFVKTNEKLRLSVSESKDDQNTTLVLMMLDNELRTSRELLAELEDQSYLDLADEREVLRNKISDNERRLLENKQLIAKDKAQLSNLLETRAIIKPLKSLKPAGMSKKLILILFVIVGFILSFLTVFFIEFLTRVKEAQLNR